MGGFSLTDVKQNKDSEIKAQKKKEKKSKRKIEEISDSALKTDSIAEVSVKKAKLGLSEEEVAEFLQTHDIAVKMPEGKTSPKPMLSFSDTPFQAKFLARCTAAGFSNPTESQAMCWPIVLAGHDIIAVAKTGSGKTLGFLSPIFHLITQDDGIKSYAPQLLVLSPTRELAMQIEQEAKKFGMCIGVKSACLYGGAPKWNQINALNAGVDVVISTPGRLCDLLDMGKADLTGVKYLVMDEADRMLEMGFEREVWKITDALPKSRQTSFFTATWPKAVEKMANSFLTNPVRVNFGSINNLQANTNVAQNVMIIENGDKMKTLNDLIKKLSDCDDPKKSHPKMIIFASKKRSVQQLATNLWEAGFKVDSIHGDREQWERTDVMKQFTKNDLRMLVATDVAARGLDVKDIKVVINFDFPVSGVEDYVHRIGRTGRAGAMGESYTFFNGEDRKHANELMKVMRRAQQPIGADLLALGGRGGKGGGKGGKGASRWSSGRGSGSSQGRSGGKGGKGGKGSSGKGGKGSR